ncbi:MAG TPA: hypothetical protein VM260_15220, partial [Pirellula sp.]|nr:hypothetical protein [Pirellula sp.]
AKAGYELRQSEGDSGTIGSPVVDISITQRFSDRTELTLAYSRRQQESVQFVGNTYTSDAISTLLAQSFGADARLRARLEAAYVMSAYETEQRLALSVQDREDTSIISGLTITYDVKLWMRVFGSYNFEWLESNDPAVVDYIVNRISIGLQLGY